MAGQDIGFFEVEGECADLLIENGDLKADNGLEILVLISLFTDRFVNVEDLPFGATDPRGWWADLISVPDEDLIGSRFWTLDRAKSEPDTESSLEEFAREALAWLIEDGIAETVAATATRLDQFNYKLEIEITKPSGQNLPLQFIWDGQELKITGVA